MTLPINTVERIILLGGGVSIDASQYPPQSLERFAALASGSETTIITMRNSQNIPTASLERIAALGNGRVVFEI